MILKLTMERLVLLLLLCVKHINSDLCFPRNTYPVEGSPVTITTYVEKTELTNGNLQWQKKDISGDFKTVTKCEPDKIPPCQSLSNGDQYKSTMENAPDGKHYNVTVTIQSLNRMADQTTWSWNNGPDVLAKCDLQVFSFGSDPVCNDLKISNDGTTYLWNCSANDVYPKATCKFFYGQSSDVFPSTVPTQYIESKSTTQEGAHPPRSTLLNYTCELMLPVEELKTAGNYSFKFYPVVSGVTKFTQTEISLVLPQTELIGCPNDTDANQGYIKKGVTDTCQCRLKDGGPPPGRPLWWNIEFELAKDQVNNSVISTLSVRYDPNNSHQEYRCMAISAVGDGAVVWFIPKFAYGPEVISLILNENKGHAIKKCEASTSFVATCNVVISSVNPKPNVVVIASDSSAVTRQPEPPGTQSGFYKNTFKVVPQKGGVLTMTCVATNSIFPSFNKSESKSVTIQEPPSSRPVMTINNGQPIENGGYVNVKSDIPFVFKCRVNGGYPEVSKVKVTCTGGKSLNTERFIDEVSQTLTFGKINDTKCKCEAEHMTGCYDKTSEIIITVNDQYAAKVVDFTANTESQEVTVAANEMVTFVCDAEGNPKPSITVHRQRPFEVIPLQDMALGPYKVRGQGQKKMLCLDTGDYNCVADNEVGDGMNKSVSIFVQCVPELAPLFDPAKELKLKNGNDLTIRVEIVGYPVPTAYTVKKVQDGNSRRRKRTAKEQVIAVDRYNVSYVPGQLPEGTVHLTMFNLSSEDSGQYVLTINNGISKGLDYDFEVKVIQSGAAKSNTGSDSDNTAVIAGVVTGVVIVIIIVIVVSVILKKRGKGSWNKYSSSDVPMKSRT